jgi:glutamate-ammonia-ligase adenylyltransferase
MQQMLPLLLDWLSASPNPDLGLLMLRNLLSGTQRRAPLVAAFRESPAVARHLCTLVGTSRLLGEVLLHHPDLVPRLPDDDRLRTRPFDELAVSATDAIGWRPAGPARQAALRRWKERHLLGIGARDVLGHAEVDQVGRDLTVLAEATVEAAVRGLDPQVPFCVIALGRFGAGELSYASDLDVVFVFDGGASEAAEAQRVAGGLLRVVLGRTPADRLYRLDIGLRPEGKHGTLARSVDSYRNYWEHYALVWERQAMIRARPVAGDRALGQRLLDALDPMVWGTGDPALGDDEVREIRRMKARIERERIPVGEDPQFHLKLGRGSLSDIEFTVQLLQLQHGIRSPGTMAALPLLAAAGALDETDAELLARSYRFCERARNRLVLVDGQGGDSLPTAPDRLLWLARSLDLTPATLREQYRRVTRRARRVVERVFYAQE